MKVVKLALVDNIGALIGSKKLNLRVGTQELQQPLSTHPVQAWEESLLMENKKTMPEYLRMFF